MPKKKPKQISEKVLFLIAAVVVAVPIIGYKMYVGNNPSAPFFSTHSPQTEKQPYVPFQKKENKVTTTQDGETTTTVREETYGVVLTPKEEQQYYGDHTEYEGWEVAYADQTLHRFPPGWGYYYGAMLTSDDSGANSRTVASMYFGRGEDKEGVGLDYKEMIDAPIGYIIPMGKLNLVKIAEFETISGTKMSKYTRKSGDLTELRYIAEEPEGQFIFVIVNAMSSDVYEQQDEAIDSIVKSMIYVPYEYR